VGGEASPITSADHVGPRWSGKFRLSNMQRGRDSELIFPIKDAASAALMLIKADCLHTAGIINEAEKQYVHSRARTFLDDATLKDAAFLISHAPYNVTISLED
jgi:hypothetical protein